MQAKNLLQIFKKGKQTKRNTKDSNQITRGGKNKETKSKMTYKSKPKTIKRMTIGTCVSKIILNVNGLNFPTKRPDCLN